MSLQNSSNFFKKAISLTITSSLLIGCGGGGSSGSTATSTQPLPVSQSTSTSQPTVTATAPTPITPTTTADSSVALKAIDLLNENRTKCGFGGLTVNQNLNNTAYNHANYLATVALANHYGFASHYEQAETSSNGTSLLQTGTSNPYYSGYDIDTRLNPKTYNEKALPAAYHGLGIENLSESFASSNALMPPVDPAVQAESMLRALFAAPYHLRMLVLPQAAEVGASFRQDNWAANNSYYRSAVLEVVSGIPANANYIETLNTLSFPCTGVVTDYELKNETPNPFGYKDSNGNVVAYNDPQRVSEIRDLEANPVGQPIYIRVPASKTIQSVNVTIKNGSNTLTDFTKLTATTDPNKMLEPYEAMIIPNQPLQPSTTYDVSYQVTLTDGTNRFNTFSFTTKANVS